HSWKRLFAAMLVVCLPGLQQAWAQEKISQDSLGSSNRLPETGNRFSHTLRWIVPGSLVAVGIAGTFDNPVINRQEFKEERMEHFPEFHHKLDDYSQWTPIVAAYALDFAGVKAKHDLVNRSVILVKSELLMMAVTYPLKKWTHVLRPDSSAYNSFPSGHTAEAFLAANFLRHEYGQRSVWYSIAGYTVASGVGVLRVLNNRHWVSDVLAGAGIGMLCSEAAYATHKFKWNKKRQITAMPWYGGKAAGVALLVPIH
ncbi:MAG TPA: phosphatase PAP2 family protein, partial [Chitinophagaceae bacterium]|nr:phosphatase PAP2 family protein [Chitinophagaceae bacterium]